ncbi:unnamed protein product [Sphacelaria rigidula]
MVPGTLDMSAPEEIPSADALHALVYEVRGVISIINPKHVIAVLGLTAYETPINQLLYVCADILAQSTSVNITTLLHPSMAASVTPDARRDLQARALLEASVDHLWATDKTTHGGLKKVGEFLVLPGAFPPPSTPSPPLPPPPLLPPRPTSPPHAPVDLTDPLPKRQNLSGSELSDAGDSTHGKPDRSAAGAASAEEEEDSDEERLLTRIYPRRQFELKMSQAAADADPLKDARFTPLTRVTDQLDIMFARLAAMKRLAEGQPPLRREMDWVRNLRNDVEDSLVRRSPALTALILPRRFGATSSRRSPAANKALQAEIKEVAASMGGKHTALETAPGWCPDIRAGGGSRALLSPPTQYP